MYVKVCFPKSDYELLLRWPYSPSPAVESEKMKIKKVFLKHSSVNLGLNVIADQFLGPVFSVFYLAEKALMCVTCKLT